MSVTRSIILLGLVARVIAQSQSSTEQMFSIQTDPATPTSSANPSSSSSSSSTSDQISAGLFPQACVDTCTPLADTFLNCGLSDLAGFNVSCLCTVEVENTFVNCVECALGAESNPQNAVATYQSLIDAYLQQCSMASTTLPDATVQVPSSSMSPSGSVSGSSASSASLSRSSGSMSSSSSAASSMSSPASASASAASSGGQSTTSAPSSASSAAASGSLSNTASRGVDGRWMWGLTGVGGVVIAAALGV